MRRIAILATLAISALTAPWAEGSLTGQATTPDGGAFAKACAGVNPGIRPAPGDAFSTNVGPVVTCNGGSSAVGGTAAGSYSSSGTFGANAYSNSAGATATVGILHLNSTSNGSTASGLSSAIASAGLNLMTQ